RPTRVDVGAGEGRGEGWPVRHRVPRLHHRRRRRAAGGVRPRRGPRPGRRVRAAHRRAGRRSGARRVRRPFTAMTAIGTAAHHGFELNAGVGLVFQPYLGLGGSLAYWGTNLPFLFWAAARGGERFDKPLAFAGGAAPGGR